MGQFEVLKKIQEIELDALKEFNNICKENNLNEDEIKKKLERRKCDGSS